jgi:hypothetical protein
VNRLDRRWPDPVQRLALLAAVGDEATAIDAWTQLNQQVELTEYWDGEVNRLLPLVYRNIGPLVDEAQQPWLRGVHRRCWVLNQTHLRHAAALVEAFAEVGIDALVLKGLALSLLYYQDLGARPMGDVDLLVRLVDADRACRLLESRGYRTLPVRPADASRWEREGDDEWYRRLRHARGFERERIEQIDLHWALSLDFVAADPSIADTGDLWAASQPLEVGGAATATLSATHHLFHAVVHGLGASTSAEVRWAADAITIMRTAGHEVDWEELVATARRHRCALMLHEGLVYLRQALGAPVPEDAVAELSRLRPGRRERALRYVRSHAGSPLLGSGYAAGLFVTTSAGLGPVTTVGHVPRFLADYWNVDHTYQVPLVVADKVWSAVQRPRRDPTQPPGAAA